MQQKEKGIIFRDTLTFTRIRLVLKRSEQRTVKIEHGGDAQRHGNENLGVEVSILS